MLHWVKFVRSGSLGAPCDVLLNAPAGPNKDVEAPLGNTGGLRGPRASAEDEALVLPEKNETKGQSCEHLICLMSQ